MVFLLLGVVGVNGVPPYTGDAEEEGESVSLRTDTEYCLSRAQKAVSMGSCSIGLEVITFPHLCTLK